MSADPLDFDPEPGRPGPLAVLAILAGVAVTLAVVSVLVLTAPACP